MNYHVEQGGDSERLSDEASLADIPDSPFANANAQTDVKV